MKNIPLNDYQQLMLNISKLTPYNAVHAVPINNCDLYTIQHEIESTLNQLNIGIPQFSNDVSVVCFTKNSQPICIEQKNLPLSRHMANEMNTTFADEHLPLRFYWITSGEQDYLTITYNHWIADAYSIMRLIEVIFEKVLGEMNGTSSKRHLYLLEDPFETYFHPIYHNKRWYYRWSGFLRKLMECAKAYRTPVIPFDATMAGCCIHHFESAELTRLLLLCKTHQITLNDCFIALLAKLFGELTLSQRKQAKTRFLKGKRDRIIISVIANIRHHSVFNLSHAFGLILGFFSLSFKEPEQYSLIDLCRMVTRRTKKIKQQHVPVKQYLLLKIQNFWWKRAHKIDSQYNLFTKNVPITAGISNIKLNPQDWSFPAQVHEYVRCSPTAMICPIIFNFTTLNKQMSLAISYRKACYADEDVMKIKSRFIRLLSKLAESKVQALK